MASISERTVSYVFKGSFGNLTAGLTAAGRNVEQLGVKLTALDKNGAKMRAGLTSIGDAGGKAGLLAAAGIGVAIAVTAKFDKQMSAAGAATNATASQLELLRKAAIKAGADTIFSASEAADGITQLGKAGVSTTDILSGGLTGALNLAAAGQIGVAEAAETTASTLNQFGFAGDQASRVADVLSASADAAQGGVTDMGQAMKYVGPLASQMGISLEQTAGSIAELASQGILGEQAGTALRGMLASLSSPSNKAADEMAALGISVYDAQGKFVGFDGVAGQLQASLGGLTAAQRDQSLGIIFGNEQLTAARILYSGGAAAVQDWTSQVTDAGHAQERASQLTNNLSGDLEQLKGSLETALIGAGEGPQGPLRSLVQGLTASVNALNNLPAPAKNAAMALGGVTAVLGGGLWFTSKAINGVADMKDALQNLGVSASGTSKAMKGLATAGAAIAGLTVVATVIRSINDAARDSLPGVEGLTENLLKLSNAGAVGVLGDQFSDLGDDLDRVFNKSWDEKIGDKLYTPFKGLLGNTRDVQEVRDEIDLLDASLANIATTQGPEVAAAALQSLADSGYISAEQLKRLRGELPQYDEALAGLRNQAKDAAGGQDMLGQSTQDAAVAANKAKVAQQALRDELRKQREDARGVAQSFIGLGDSLDDSKKSLSQWLKELEQQNEALRNFTANAQRAAKRGLEDGLIQSLNEAGPAGALRMKQLANATDAELARANHAWRQGQDAIKSYVQMEVPTKKPKVDAGPAMAAIDRLRTALANVKSKDVEVRVHYLNIGNKLAGMAAERANGAAAGGTIPGPHAVLPAHLTGVAA